jgi:hypothetical protein
MRIFRFSHFISICFRVVLNSPRREMPKDAIKKNLETNRFWLGRFFCKMFSTRCFCKSFLCSDFKLPSLRNTRKTRGKKKSAKNGYRYQKKTEKKSSKTHFVVFLNCPCYEALQNAINKIGEKKPKNQKKKAGNCQLVFFGAAANVRYFHPLLFHAPPWLSSVVILCAEEGPPSAQCVSVSVLISCFCEICDPTPESRRSLSGGGCMRSL